MFSGIETEMLRSIKKHLIISIILSIAIAAVIGIYEKQEETDHYELKMTVAVLADDSASNKSIKASINNANFLYHLISSSSMAEKISVLSGEKMELQDIQSKISSSYDSQFIYITINDDQKDSVQKLSDNLFAAISELKSEYRINNEIKMSNISIIKQDDTDISIMYLTASFFGSFVIISFVFYLFTRYSKQK